MKKLFTGILIGVVIAFGLFESGKYAYAQYQARTIGALLPGATMAHANRYYETYSSPGFQNKFTTAAKFQDTINIALPESLIALTVPFQHKSYLRGIWMRKIGRQEFSRGSSMVKLYVTRQLDCGSGNSLLNDTTDYLTDSLWTTIDVTTVDDADTVGAGQNIAILGYNGTADSTGIADSLFHIQIRFELEMIEPR